MELTRSRATGRLVLAAVVIYLASLAIAGALTPGYRHSSQLISELGEVGAPLAWLWRLNLGFAGLATVLLARALHHEVGSGGAGTRSALGAWADRLDRRGAAAGRHLSV
jgi:hypothetical membrane protein